MSDNEKDQQKAGRRTGLPGQSDKGDSSRAPGSFAADASAPPPDIAGRAAGAQESGEGGGGTPRAEAQADAQGTQGIDEREMQFMITPRRTAGLGPMNTGGFGTHAGPDMARIYDELNAMKDVAVVRRVRPSALSPLSTRPGANHDIIVAKVKASERLLLTAFARLDLIVERDYLIGHLADANPRVAAKVGVRPLRTSMASITLQFRVQDSGGAPQPNCSIVLYTNAGAEDEGISDQQGNATLTVPIGYINDIAAIYIKPFAGCWEQFTYRPKLQGNAVNTVVLQRLSEFAGAGFAEPAPGARSFFGWGQRLMGLPHMPPGQMGGRGIKVAIIDSGCDSSHPALTHIKHGQDYTNLDAKHMPDSQSWANDAMGHGTHCAGVIAGNGSNGHIRGFVPDAEIHVLKLFPGGAFNNLAAALHYCIDNKIDVVNCSLGGDQVSEAIEQLIDTARQAGVAVVVAAGNSGNAVQFPASAPGVMCVAALGELGEFPENTYHARTLTAGTSSVDGLFPANFSCRGPQVDLCAPGVAVISSVPGGGYAAWDGTSMAAPAVTGLLAMVLAHHTEFAGKGVPRNAQRVNRLFQLVASAAMPLAMPPEMVGFGVPRLMNAPVQAAARPSEIPIQGNISGQINQAQLQEIIRSAFLSGLGALGDANRPPAR